MIVTEDRRSFKILVNNFEQRSGSNEIIYKDREQWGSFFNQDRDWDYLESKWSWESQDRNQDRARRSWSRTFFDSRWLSVTRSWAKVVVLHKILIKIVRQNVPKIFATILAKTVLKIVNEDREWCCIHSCINIFNTWLNKFIRRRDWWINCGLLNLIGYLNQTRINWLDSIESTDFTF